MKNKRKTEIIGAIHKAYKVLIQSGDHIVGRVSFKDLYQTAKCILPHSLIEFKFVMREIHNQDPLKYQWDRAPEIMIDKRYAIGTHYGLAIQEHEKEEMETLN